MTDITSLTDVDDVTFSRQLVESPGVAVVPGSSFYSRPELGRTKIRFAFPRSSRRSARPPIGSRESRSELRASRVRRVGVRRALVIAVAMAAVLASCAAEPPVPSPSPGAPSPSASARVSQSPTASSIALDHPPACLDAKLLWAHALNRLILANCIDQFDLASLETVWAWDGERWELLSDDGPPATVVTGFGWDPARDVLVRYGGIPVPEQDCITETWEWDMAEWREVEAEPPEPCDHVELAWDGVYDRMIMFGGGRGSNLLPGTWSWAGTDWTHLTDAGPAPRAHHGMAGSIDGRRRRRVWRPRQQPSVRRSLGMGRIGVGG